MELMHVLAITLIASVSVNVFLCVIHAKSKKKRVNSIEATEILHDLTVNGQALVRVQRIDPNDFLLRSPRR